MKILNIIIFTFIIKTIICINIEIANYGNCLITLSDINNQNNFRFLLDTGSFYTIVSGIKKNITNHNYYKLKSNDKKKLIKPKNNEPLSKVYNGGNKVNFSLYDFDFTINKKNTIHNVPIGITSYEYDFSNIVFDGIIGLGGFYGNETIINNTINNIMTTFMLKQKIITKNIFSLYINNIDYMNFKNPQYYKLNKNGGKIIFGDIDKNNHEEIKWYDVYKKDNIYYFWNLFLNEIKIDEDKKIIINDKILVDSGTSDIILDKYSTENIHNQINGTYNEISKRYIINNLNDLKNITFKMEMIIF